MLKKLKCTCVVFVGISALSHVWASAPAPAPAAPAWQSTVKNLLGIQDPAPPPPPQAPQVIEKVIYVNQPAAPAAVPVEPAAPPPPIVDDIPPPIDDIVKDSDFSKIQDPMLRSCALNFQADMKSCTTGGNCAYEAQNKLKGCIRPVIARILMKKYVPLFDEADQIFNNFPVYSGCTDKFLEFLPRCENNKMCEETLYYSLHNKCGKRLYVKDAIAQRSATIEGNIFGASSSSTASAGG